MDQLNFKNFTSYEEHDFMSPKELKTILAQEYNNSIIADLDVYLIKRVRFKKVIKYSKFKFPKVYTGCPFREIR